LKSEKSLPEKQKEGKIKKNNIFLPPSLPKISCSIEGTATRPDVAFYFMPGAEQWYKYQSRLLWHPFKLTKLFDSLA
jgi:hypothetical protein